MVTAILDRLRTARLVPMSRQTSIAVARQSCHLPVDEGVGVAAITVTVPGTAGLISEQKNGFPARVVGAGPVLSKPEAGEPLEADGAYFRLPCWTDDVAASALCVGMGGTLLSGEAHQRADMDAGRSDFSEMRAPLSNQKT